MRRADGRVGDRVLRRAAEFQEGLGSPELVEGLAAGDRNALDRDVGRGDAAPGRGPRDSRRHRSRLLADLILERSDETCLIVERHRGRVPEQEVLVEGQILAAHDDRKHRELHGAVRSSSSTTFFRGTGSRRRRGPGDDRLLVLDRNTGPSLIGGSPSFPRFAREGDILVRNDVRVRRARLYGRDEEAQTRRSLPPADGRRRSRRWEALAKPGRRAKEEERFDSPKARSARRRRRRRRPAPRSFGREIDERASGEDRQRPPAPYIAARAGRSRQPGGHRGLPDRLRP